MEIPGIAPLSGQPTLTNPLNSERQVEGRTTQGLEGSETQNTVTSQDKSSTTVNNAEVVSQIDETSSTGFDTKNIGNSIDITA
ncbi:MAG: hypothetical protein COA90_03640 [Gammaproteobacteria bacterium]|nr:MAG: hypothetical protein COA90_03640 [Gammaproteobacteria bacterium]